jgi:hypothetical protein
MISPEREPGTHMLNDAYVTIWRQVISIGVETTVTFLLCDVVEEVQSVYTSSRSMISFSL